MSLNKELTFADRLKIEQMYNEDDVKWGITSKIAEVVGCHPDTIYRELKRGQFFENGIKKYSSYKAQNLHNENVKNRFRRSKYGENSELLFFLSEMIGKRKYSPRMVVDYIKENGLFETSDISYATIYRYVKSGLIPNVTEDDLPCKGERKTNKYRVEEAKKIERAKENMVVLSNRYDELDMIFKHMYEHMIRGLINEERFKKLSTEYEREQREIREKIAKLKNFIEK